MTGMELGRLVEGVTAVRATSKKTEKTQLLANLLKQAQGRDIELVALYLVGTLPQGRIGIGWRIIEQASADLPVANASLSLHQIDQMLDGIATDEGAGSTGRKIQALRALFERADRAERDFLTQLLMGEVRQGALEGLLLDAIAKAANLPQADVRQAFMFSGNIGEIARAALERGAAGLADFGLRLLTPISPMLANSAEDTSEALDRMGEAAFEFKLDGARIQVHRQGDEVRIFTRQLQDVTERLPEIVEWTRLCQPKTFCWRAKLSRSGPMGDPILFRLRCGGWAAVRMLHLFDRSFPLLLLL